jgi:cell division protein FtsI (penicillin-binding protein 3)
LLLVVFAMIGAGFVALLVDLQAIRADEVLSRPEAQRTRTRSLAGYRGDVVDRNGFVLAASTPSHEVVADPKLIIDPAASAALLGPVLGLDVAELTEELTPDSPSDRYAQLARTVPDEAVEQIRAFRNDERTATRLVGVFVRPEEARVYPAGPLARSVVGQVDPEEQGISGLEKQYDEIMTGTPGQVQFESSRFGTISVADWSVDPAEAGYDLILALDHRMQYSAEAALLAQCEATGAAGATAVVTAPATGEVLAMAAIRRNRDTGDCEVAGYNPALVTAFEPGSVLKTVTLAAAIEELGFTGETLIEVPPKVVVGDKSFEDHPAHPAAPYPVSEILADSMNVGTIKVAQAVGPGKVHEYLDRFGFGRPTGIDFVGETSGRLRDLDDWWGSDAGSIPIGQGVSVNATQLAAAYNVVADGGRYRSPILVRALRAPDGTEHHVDPGPGLPVISERTAAELTELLVGVVDHGTGQSAAIPGYTVAGKTGTAWKAYEDENGRQTYGVPGRRRYVSTFAGFAPAEDPAVSIVVVIDEPSNGVTYASAVAAPVFAEIGAAALRLLEVAPDRIVREGDGRVRADPALAAPDTTGGEDALDGSPTAAPDTPADTAGTPASDTAATAAGGADSAAVDSGAASAREREGEAVALAVDADLARDAGSP